MTKARANQLPVKHIPSRTCIGCRKTFAKRELIRLVCLPEGQVEIDLSGKKSGRGAYLCHSPACWKGALKSGTLEKAMRSTLQAQSREQLVKYAEGLNNTGN